MQTPRGKKTAMANIPKNIPMLARVADSGELPGGTSGWKVIPF
jgi:hypothetical protein